MLSILFLGYSNLVKGRILPILSKTPFRQVAIAKYEGQRWDDKVREFDYQIRRYESYDEGLDEFAGDVVYISTVNSSHYEYAKKALLKGSHVIIDKPATFTYAQCCDLVEIAKRNEKLVCESTVYLYHPQLTLIDNIFRENGDVPKLLTAHFSFPPFLPDNFRYRKELGGGALMDTLPYAVSIGRYFFREFPADCHYQIHEVNDDGLDIEYSLLLEYAGGKSMIGHFGFNTEYINQITILGTYTNVIVNRIFTTPDTLENPIIADHRNERKIYQASCGHAFTCFFNEVADALYRSTYDGLYDDMLYDARVKSMIINN